MMPLDASSTIIRDPISYAFVSWDKFLSVEMLRSCCSQVFYKHMDQYCKEI